MMFWILLLVGLTSSVCEDFVRNMTSGGDNSDVFPTTPKLPEEDLVSNVTSGGDNSDVFLTTPKLPEEDFVFNVTSRGNNSDIFLTTPEDPNNTTKVPKKEVKSDYWTKEKLICGSISIGVVIVALLVGLVNEAVIKKRRSKPGQMFLH